MDHVTIDQSFISQIVELAKDMESQYQIDFGMMNVDEDQLYHLIASSVSDKVLNNPEMSHQEQLMMALATATVLVVENFVLNYHLHSKNS